MTPSELRMLDYIRDYLDQRGFAPTATEAGKHFGYSHSRASRVINALIEQGKLRRTCPGRRGLEVPSASDLRAIPTAALRAELGRRGETLDALRRPERHSFSRHAVTCAVDFCDVVVRRGHLMCYEHWIALPMKLRTDTLAAFVANDEEAYGALVYEAREIAAAATARHAA